MLLITQAAHGQPSVSGATKRLAQSDYVVDFWRVEQGLPHNTVNALLQTRDGYFWVGTASGLARFDGLSFTSIAPASAPALKAAHITALLEGRDGGLWIGTQSQGVFLRRGGNMSQFGLTQGLSDNSVTGLAEDTSGRVWIGTQGGLDFYDPPVRGPGAAGKDRLAVFSLDAAHPGDPIVALHAGRSGVVWITTHSAAYKLQGGRAEPQDFEDMPQGRSAEFVGAYEDHAGDLWIYGATFLRNVSQNKRFNYFRSLDPASSRVWTICEQSDAFWIGTSGRGLYRFHDGQFDVTGAREGLDQCDVRALQADSEGNLWIGTSGSGLARLSTRHWRILGSGDGLTSSRLTALAAGRPGELWVGTADAGLLRRNGERFEPVTNGPPFGGVTRICSLCVDGSGALWAGTGGDGLFRLAGERQWQFTTAEGLSDNVVSCVAAEPKGTGVWAGTLAGGMHRISETNLLSFTAADGLTGRPVLCLLPTTDGGVFIGSESGGLVRWDGHGLKPVPGPPPLRERPIRSLALDRKGRLWAAAANAGLFCRVGGNWVALGSAQGLPGDTILQMMQDEQGDFWFGSEQGIFEIRAPDLEKFLGGNNGRVNYVLIRRDERVESLKNAEGWPTAVRDADREHWFATEGGILAADPEQAQSGGPLPVIIEQVLVNGKPEAAIPSGGAGAPLRLGPGLRSLDFAFTALNFTAPEKTRFRQKLETFDADWIGNDGTRKAHYGQLPPGRYRFRVAASETEDAGNTSTASLSFIIAPPLWREPWMLTLFGVVLVAAIWAAVRAVALRRLRVQLRLSEQRRGMERERSRIARDMHDEIGSKLTRISFLSEVARNAGAEAPSVMPPIEGIADTSRELLKALDEIVWAVNPRNDNLENLAGYLEQYAREYFSMTSVECEMTLPPRLPAVPLSAELRHNIFLAFQEALTNSLKHGQPTRIRIHMGLEPRAFEIRIEDNGKGFAAVAGQGIGQDGLGNMRERLRVAGGMCEIASTPGQGTKVLFRFPLPGARLVESAHTPPD